LISGLKKAADHPADPRNVTSVLNRDWVGWGRGVPHSGENAGAKKRSAGATFGLILD
jgi:hypothetical protein